MRVFRFNISPGASGESGLYVPCSRLSPKAAQRDAPMGVVASIPEDVLDKAARWLEIKDLLCLRAVSPSGRNAVRRAIAKKAIPRVRKLFFDRQQYVLGGALAMQASPQAVEAMGRVFGAGCVDLCTCGTSAHSLAALYSFVCSTNGGLRTLSLFESSISSDLLLVMCRAAPNLVSLSGPRYVHTSDDAIVAIAAACPQLEDVWFSDVGTGLSPAERWQGRFPRLKWLTLRNYDSSLQVSMKPPYRPTLLEAISEAARSTCAEGLNLDGCPVFPDLIEAIVGTPLGDRLTSLGSGESGLHTNIEPAALLAAARGFPRLTEFWIPSKDEDP